MASGYKQELATGYVRNLFGEALASIQAGKMAGDPNVYVWWKAIDLDEQGRKEAEEEQAAHVGRLLEIEARTNERMAQESGRGQTISTVLAILGFARQNH